MDLKFFLNKFIKADNIEYYPMKYLHELRKRYERFLESSGGTDPDFPMMSFGDKGGQGSESFKGKNNVISIGEDGEQSGGKPAS